MNTRVASVLLIVLLAVLFLQCSSREDKPAPEEPVRTVQNVDTDLQLFKAEIRSKIDSRSNLYLVVGGISVAFNLLLFGFVLYFWKQHRHLAAAQKKKRAKTQMASRKAPGKIVEENDPGS